MNKMIYSPNDIPQDTFTSLGKSEYESIASRIIAESQKAGRWISVRPPFKCGAFGTEPQILEDMIEEGLLKRKGGLFRSPSYMITEYAMGIIKRSHDGRHST